MRTFRATALLSAVLALACGDDGGSATSTTSGSTSTTSTTTAGSSSSTDDSGSSTSTTDTTASTTGSTGAPDETTGGTEELLVLGPPAAVVELNSGAREDDPSLRYDGLEIYFSRDDGNGAQIFRATRARPADAWSGVEAIAELASADSLTAPELSLDGLVMTVTTDASGDLNLLVTTRADYASPWTAPVPIDELNTATDELNGHITDDGFTIVFCSNRLVGQPQLFRSARADLGDAFDSPEHVVAFSNVDACDPWFDAPLGILVYAGGPTGTPTDLFAAVMIGATAQPPTDLSQVNTDDDESSPWLYLDATFEGQLYFSRAGDLFAAPATLAP